MDTAILVSVFVATLVGVFVGVPILTNLMLIASKQLSGVHRGYIAALALSTATLSVLYFKNII